MSVNGIYSNNISDTYTANTTTKEKIEKVDKGNAETVEGKQETVKTDDTAAVYDKTKLSEDDRKAIVSQLKADQEKRQAQLTELVQNMISKQTNAFGEANDIWKFLAKGDYIVDAETKKKAQEDISEDGYWGVKQTSQRLFDFASALAGDDVEKMKEMQAAMKKGFEKAEKTWGSALPEISKQTMDAANKLFDDYFAAQGTEE